MDFINKDVKYKSKEEVMNFYSLPINGIILPDFIKKCESLRRETEEVYQNVHGCEMLVMWICWRS